MATQNFVFDGVTPIDSDAFFWHSDWDDGWTGYVSFWNGNEPGPHTANITLTDSNWTIHTLRFSGDGGIFTTITDTASGDGRSIRNLDLGEGGGIVTLDRTSVRQLASNGAVTLTTGREWIETVLLRDGDDVVDIGSGGANYIDLGGGSNSITVRGDDSVTFLNSRGDTDITLLGDSRILMVKVGDGTNTMTTGTGFVESYFSYMAANTLTIGEGGVGAIQFYGADQHQIIRATGFIGSVQAGDEITVDLELGAEGASTIHLANSGNTVRTGSGFVGYIGTGNGDDLLDIGSGAVGAARLREGDDTLIVRTTGADNGSYVNAGGGVDTLDLSRIGASVTLDLSQAGWQEVSADRGMLRVHNFENLIGGARGDRLTGNEFDNVLTGGLGNDTLTGNLGIDTFVFGRGTGRDTITDFTAGTDLIDLTGATGMGQIRITDAGDDVLIRFGRARILIEDAAVADIRDADNFLF